jgi:hypothetical protein
MDTNLAISTLVSLKSTIDADVTGLQAQSDALGIAISQLQGTLVTQDKALEAEVIDLQAQVNSAQAATTAITDTQTATP